MTDTAALDALIEAVEAGGLPTFPTTCQAVGGNCAENIDGAFNGSLDAAKALHEALLPGWGVQNLGSVNYDGSGGWVCRITGPNFLEDFQQESAHAKDPARSWLLATLKAYRASL